MPSNVNFKSTSRYTLYCLHCGGAVSSEGATIPYRSGEPNMCPSCGKPGLYVGRTGVGEVRFCAGLKSGFFGDSIRFSDFTPDELRLIADTLEAAEEAGWLHFPDGSGDGKAGRKVSRKGTE